MGQAKGPTAAEVARKETAAGSGGKQASWQVVVDGVRVSVSLDVLDDFDLIDQVTQGNPYPILHAFFGRNYRERVKPLEDNTGHLKVSRVIEWVGKVFQAVGAKNS